MSQMETRNDEVEDMRDIMRRLEVQKQKLGSQLPKFVWTFV